jgi:hypothetical protein
MSTGLQNAVHAVLSLVNKIIMQHVWIDFDKILFCTSREAEVGACKCATDSNDEFTSFQGEKSRKQKKK